MQRRGGWRRREVKGKKKRKTPQLLSLVVPILSLCLFSLSLSLLLCREGWDLERVYRLRALVTHAGKRTDKDRQTRALKKAQKGGRRRTPSGFQWACRRRCSRRWAVSRRAALLSSRAQCTLCDLLSVVSSDAGEPEKRKKKTGGECCCVAIELPVFAGDDDTERRNLSTSTKNASQKT